MGAFDQPYQGTFSRKAKDIFGPYTGSFPSAGAFPTSRDFYAQQQQEVQLPRKPSYQPPQWDQSGYGVSAGTGDYSTGYQHQGDQRSVAPSMPPMPDMPGRQPGEQRPMPVAPGQVDPWERETAAQNARVRQQGMQDYARGLIDRQTKLQEQANREIKQRQQTSEKMFSGLIEQYQGDPMFKSLQSSIYNWMQNPGLSQGTLRKLQAQSQARAAADLASNQRSIQTQAARHGMSSSQMGDAMWGAKSRSSAGLSRAMTNIDLQNEQMRQSGRGQAIQAGGSLLGQRYSQLGGMARSYADVLGSYNPQVAPLNTYDLMQNVYGNPNYGGEQQQYNPYPQEMPGGGGSPNMPGTPSPGYPQGSGERRDAAQRQPDYIEGPLPSGDWEEQSTVTLMSYPPQYQTTFKNKKTGEIISRTEAPGHPEPRIHNIP